MLKSWTERFEWIFSTWSNEIWTWNLKPARFEEKIFQMVKNLDTEILNCYFEEKRLSTQQEISDEKLRTGIWYTEQQILETRNKENLAHKWHEWMDNDRIKLDRSRTRNKFKRIRTLWFIYPRFLSSYYRINWVSLRILHHRCIPYLVESVRKKQIKADRKLNFTAFRLFSELKNSFDNSKMIMVVLLFIRIFVVAQSSRVFNSIILRCCLYFWRFIKFVNLCG